MRVFLTLCSMAALTLAKPQYNYGSGISGSFGGSAGSYGNVGGLIGLGLGGLSSSSGGSFGGSAMKFQGGSGGRLSSGSIGGGSLLGSGSIGGGSSFGSGSSFGFGSTGGGFSLGSGSSFGSGSVGGGFSQQQQQQRSAQFEAPFVHKQFITVAAPEDNENLERTKHLVIGRPQKNYRVVFIKAPSSSNANVKLSAEYAPQEEKTVIYVLSKKDSSLEVSDIATPAPSVSSKPEVFFIKYKTEEEAQHAQKQIQAEYDRIQGSSEHTDAGVAPQQSVVGILDGVNGGVSGNSAGADFGGSGNAIGAGSGISGSFVRSSTSSTNHNAAKSSAYLPPSAH